MRWLLIWSHPLLYAQSPYDIDFLKMAQAGQAPLVRALLDAGANPETRDEAGRTALMLAASEGHYETVVALLDRGVNRNAQDENGLTALMMAERDGRDAIVELLRADQKGDRSAQPPAQNGVLFSEEAWESDLVRGQQGLQHRHYDEAEEAFSAALERARKLGEDDPLVAMSLSYLGLLYHQQGQYSRAESLYRRALTINEVALGAEHPHTAGVLNNLGAVYLQQLKYDQAEPLYQRCLKIAKKVLGPEHPDTATSLNNLAALYHRQEKYAQAEPLYERALAITEQALGPDNEDNVTSLNNLAALYRQQEKYAQAEPLYRRSLATVEKNAGTGPCRHRCQPQ